MSSKESRLKKIASHSLPKYLVTGGAMSALDWGLFTSLSVGLKTPPLLANICSTVLTICVSYFLNQRFVFKASRPTLKSFFSFSGLTLFTGLVLQSIVIYCSLHLCSFYYDPLPTWSAPVAKILAMAVGATCNYLGYRYLFKKSDRR